MTESKFPKYLKALARNKKGGQGNTGQGAAAPEPEPEFGPCCQGNVHIFYRGVSDDKMYMSRDRSFGEIKYFRPHGLRVFCADCRRRLI
jgi:hypothetical protein